MTVVRVRERGALGRTISFAADPQPTFAAEFCCVLSREGVRKKLCNSDQAHFTALCQKQTHALRNELNVPDRCEATFCDVKNTYNK